MVEEKSNEEKKEEKSELKEKQVRKASAAAGFLDKFKKHAVTVGTGIGAFVLSLIVFMLFFKGGEVPPEKMEPVQEVQVGVGPKTDSEISGEPAARDSASTIHEDEEPVQDVFTAEDLEQFVIDTQKIMQELNFLFATPESELQDMGFTAQDSIDTLNWLDREMSRLEKEKGEIKQRRRQLENLEKRIDQAMTQINKAESTRIMNLARLYDGMKAQDVAKLFANLSDEIIISILPRMKPANASKILGYLPPKRAAKISTQMITVLEDK